MAIRSPATRALFISAALTATPLCRAITRLPAAPLVQGPITASPFLACSCGRPARKPSPPPTRPTAPSPAPAAPSPSPPLAANHFAVSTPPTAITGTPFAVTVTAQDRSTMYASRLHRHCPFHQHRQRRDLAGQLHFLRHHGPGRACLHRRRPQYARQPNDHRHRRRQRRSPAPAPHHR